MDLVSNTLDKYLRHRFNILDNPNNPTSVTSNNGNDRSNTNDTETSPLNNDEPPQSIGASSDANAFENSMNSIKIHSLSFSKIKPCCVAIRDDLSYIAAGFENSQIYLWTLVQEPGLNSGGFSSLESFDEAENGNAIHQLETMTKLTAHSGAVYSVQFLIDNDLMLSCSEDSTIRLWCLKSKCNLFVYRGHSYPVWSITVANQGDYFASASMDTTARLWRFDKMCPVRIFCGHESDVVCVRFHPNAKYIATGSSDSTVRLWNISDGRMVRLMVSHNSSIKSLSFSPNGKFLASAGSDGTVKIWDLATNSTKHEFYAPAACKFSFSPHQEFISTCGRDNVLRLWQIEKSVILEKKQINFSNELSNVIELHFHRNNRLFVVGFLDDLPKQTEINKH